MALAILGDARLRDARMNQTERAHAVRLTAQESRREILAWGYNRLTFTIGAGDRPARYTPDFDVLCPDGTFELHEIKGGFIREAAAVRLSVAARTYPMFRWIRWQLAKGVWTRTVIG